MSKNLVKNPQDMIKTINQFLDREDVWNQVSTRACDKKAFQLQTFDNKNLKVIAENMPEINRATQTLGRKNTQTTNRLMTLTMLNGTSSFRILRQCLSQIESKRNAIKESRFRLKKDVVTLTANIKEIDFHKEKLKDKNLDGLQKVNLCKAVDLLVVEIEEKEAQIADSILYVEGALKDIASFQSAYIQVCKNKNIPANWDEEDAEKAEINHHLRMVFLLAYRDVKAHGRLGAGTLEYSHQFGILPDMVEGEIAYIIQFMRDNGGDYDIFEDWLDEMALKYKDNYLDVLKRIGLDELYDFEFVYKEKDK